MPEPATAPAVEVEQDPEVQFLAALVPPSPGERTRAFATLLRAVTSGAAR